MDTFTSIETREKVQVILRDGASDSGQFPNVPSGEINFTDTQGVQYKFPVRDIASLVFSSTTDIVTLRNGKIYSGQYNGSDALSFQDQEGIQYQFPNLATSTYS